VFTIFCLIINDGNRLVLRLTKQVVVWICRSPSYIRYMYNTRISELFLQIVGAYNL